MNSMWKRDELFGYFQSNHIAYIISVKVLFEISFADLHFIWKAFKHLIVEAGHVFQKRVRALKSKSS